MARHRPRRRVGANSAKSRAGGRPLGLRLLVVGITLCVLVWGVGIAVASQIGTDEGNSSTENQEANAVNAGNAGKAARPNGGPCASQVVCIIDEYDWDIYDKRLIIGYSQNVFAGRVTERAGTEAAKTSIPGDDEDPHTQYVVEVLGVVKSEGSEPLSAGDHATVDQLGGPGARTEKRHVAAPLSCHQQSVGGPLAVGDEYLFATRYDADNGHYEVSAPPAGAEPVDSVGTRKDTLTAYRRAADQQLDPLAGDEDLCH